MRRTALALACLGVVGGTIGARDAEANDDAARALAARLDAALDGHKQPGIKLGASVVDLRSGRVLYRRADAEPMIPASNMKLLVMAAAIEQLGPDYRFKTVLAARGRDLVIVGSGDPTFGDDRLSRQRGEPITAVFHEWAAALSGAGIRQVPGDIVVDDSIFDDRFVHPAWPADQYDRWYEAPTGGLNFNSNCIDVRVSPSRPGQPARVSLVPGNTYVRLENSARTGDKNAAAVHRGRDSDVLRVTGTVQKSATLGPVTVRDPGLYFGSVFRTVLAAKGIRVQGAVRRARVRTNDGGLPGDCHVVAVYESPLSDALSRAGKNSLGMAAEALIKTLGAERTGLGSWESGAAALGAFLGSAAVSAGAVTIDDGSGLSRNNRVSPVAMTAVLRHVYGLGGAKFDVLRDSLAVGGVDGTLDKRMRDAATRGRVFAKTGYINRVRTLAGYVRTADDRWLAFAFFYNDAKKTYPMRQTHDEACRVLATWRDDGRAP